jgi:hypothetical protein
MEATYQRNFSDSSQKVTSALILGTTGILFHADKVIEQSGFKLTSPSKQKKVYAEQIV